MKPQKQKHILKRIEQDLLIILLRENKYFSINELSAETQLCWSTTKKYLKKLIKRGIVESSQEAMLLKQGIRKGMIKKGSRQKMEKNEKFRINQEILFLLASRLSQRHSSKNSPEHSENKVQ